MTLKWGLLRIWASYPTSNHISMTISLSQYRATLPVNMALLTSALSDRRFPNLSKLLRAYGDSLYIVIQCMHDYIQYYGEREGQEWDSDETGHRAYASYDTMVDMYGGSKQTWVKGIRKLCALGLLNAHVPRTTQEGRRQNTYRMAVSAERAKDRGQKPVRYYSIPTYTLELFQEAEALTPLVRNGAAVDKDSMRDAFGSETANRLTDNGFKLSPDTAQRRRLIRCCLMALIADKGYTTKAEVLYYADLFCWRLSASSDAYNEQRWKDTYKGYWRQLSSDLQLKGTGPTDEERERFNLVTSKYIIRQAK